MKCAKCGYERQSRDDAFVPLSECPACGVIYTKHDKTKEPSKGANAPLPPHLKPSPVDPASLRKARERVEKKLRERLGSQVKDKRHAQTLELAKRLTTEQMRKRRDERQQAHHEKDASQSLPEKPATEVQPPETQDLKADAATAFQTAHAADHQTVDTVQAETKKMTPAEASAPEVVDPPAPSAEKSSAPDCESQSAAAGPPPSEEEAVLLEDVVKEAGDRPVAAQQAEMHEASGAVQPVADNALSEPESSLPIPSIAASAKQYQQKAGRGGGLTRLLPVVAWLILVAGVIGAILSWTTIGDVEAGVRIPVPESMGTLPLGLLLGFAYLATGVLGFAFFWVSSLISIQLRDIHRLLMYAERGCDPDRNAQTEQ